MSGNTGFYAGGQKFEAWKDWSLPAASNFLPPAAAEYTSHPIFDIPLAEGMYFYDTTENVFKVYDGSDWVSTGASGGIGGDQTITAQWQFDLMPTVGPSEVPIVPAGGTAGQQLSKIDGDDWNTQWVDPPSGTFDPAFGYVITGAWRYNEDITLGNTKVLVARNQADNADIQLIKATSGDVVGIGDSNNNIIQTAFALQEFRIATDPVMEVRPYASGSLGIKDKYGQFSKVAFRNAPRRTETSGSINAAQEDEGRFIVMNGADDLTLPQLDMLTNITVISRDGGFDLLQGAGVTINWYSGSGSLVQGARTIAAYSVIHLHWRSVTNVEIWGNGIS